jgi:uncharacterized protein (TIGR02246 family)
MSCQVRTPRLRGFVIVLGIVLVAGLAVAQPAGLRAAIEAANAQFAADFAKGDATAVASHYAETGQVFPPNGDVVRGREAIARFWKGVMDAGIKGVKLVTVDVEMHRNVAVEVGTYVLTGEGGKTLDNGKYLVVWKREGRQWRLHRDIWNTSVPAPK